MKKCINRRGHVRWLEESYGIDKFSLHYRDRAGCIIYATRNDIFVDVPGETRVMRSDKGNHHYKGFKTILPFTIPNYLIITKVLLKDNKAARRWFNKIVKKNFIYAGKSFENYFTPSGAIDWAEVEKMSEQPKDFITFLIDDEDNSSWKGYNPFSDTQLGLSNWLIN